MRFNSKLIKPDVSFGYVLFDLSLSDDDFDVVLEKDEQIRAGYIASLYLFDHVNGLAYPLFSYKRLNLRDAISVYDVKTVKETFSMVRDISRLFLDSLQKNIYFSFPETKEAWDKRSLVDLDFYNLRLERCLERFFSEVASKSDDLNHSQAQEIWSAFVSSPSVPVKMDSVSHFDMFLDGEKKARSQQAFHSMRADRDQKKPKVP